MTKEEYKELNDYLNIIFKELEKNDWFLLKNLSPIGNMSESFSHFSKKNEFRESDEETYLSFEDIFNISRKIIGSFSKKYLDEFDKILYDGTIEFNYNKDGYGCWQKIRNNKILIDIERKFNYIDVVSLIHEFIHCMNCDTNKITLNRYLLTEFLSIYFEIYAQRYLMQHYDVSKNSLGIYFRLENTEQCSKNINWYYIPFYTYFNIGNIDGNSYQFTNQYFIKESKESFDEEVKELLKSCKNKESEYRENLNRKNFNENQFGKYLVEKLGFTSAYRYLFGTVLAYYAIDNVDVKNIIELNDFINSEESANMSPIDLLYKFGIDLDSDFMEKAFDGMNKILDDKKRTR